MHYDQKIKLLSSGKPLLPCSNFYFSDFISIRILEQSEHNIVPAFSHTHSEYEFLIPGTPMDSLFNDGVSYYANVGWVYPTPPSCVHGLTASLSNVAFTDLLIDRNFMEEIILSQKKEIYNFRQPFKMTTDLNLYVRSLLNEFKKEDRNEQILYHLTYVVCLTLISAMFSTLNPPKNEKDTGKGILEIADYIDEHYCEDISIDQLAEKIGFSKYYFFKIFKDVIGESPLTYLNKLRITKAKYLLENSTMPISDIAFSCGFNHPSSFTSQFKRCVKLSPTQYRKKMAD